MRQTISIGQATSLVHMYKTRCNQCFSSSSSLRTTTSGGITDDITKLSLRKSSKVVPGFECCTMSCPLETGRGDMDVAAGGILSPESG